MRGDREPYRPPEPWRPVPEPAGPAGWLEERLFDRRVVLLHGPLNAAAATQSAAALLTLDAMGREPIQLHLSVSEGELSAAFAVVDAIDAMRAPVHVLVTAEAGGAAVAVLAAADRRLAYRHARIRRYISHSHGRYLSVRKSSGSARNSRWPAHKQIPQTRRVLMNVELGLHEFARLHGETHP